MDARKVSSAKQISPLFQRVVARFEEEQTQRAWTASQESRILRQLHALQWQKVSKQAEPCHSLIPEADHPTPWLFAKIAKDLTQ